MQYKWLNKKENKNLIVFFNGWGMSEKAVSHLDFDGYDVLTFFDYRSFEIENFDFSKYEKKVLIAWSMGVYVCNYFFDIFKNFDKFIAINGTQKPIDDNFGIPTAIYNLTVYNFNDLSCAKFMKKISTKDKIIPSKNQMNFWKNAQEIDGAHYIFDKFKSWEELL